VSRTRVSWAVLALASGLAGSQAASCSKPQNSCPAASPALWIAYDEHEPPAHRVMLRTTILRDGSVSWAGRIISDDQLATYLMRSRRMDPAPYHVVSYEKGVACSRIGRLRGMFEQHAACGRQRPCSERMGE